jgi:hypothetical protein
MFNWVCPACLKVVPLAENECPRCGGQPSPASAMRPVQAAMRKEGGGRLQFWLRLGLACATLVGLPGVLLVLLMSVGHLIPSNSQGYAMVTDRDLEWLTVPSRWLALVFLAVEATSFYRRGLLAWWLRNAGLGAGVSAAVNGTVYWMSRDAPSNWNHYSGFRVLGTIVFVMTPLTLFVMAPAFIWYWKEMGRDRFILALTALLIIPLYGLVLFGVPGAMR